MGGKTGVTGFIALLASILGLMSGVVVAPAAAESGLTATVSPAAASASAVTSAVTSAVANAAVVGGGAFHSVPSSRIEDTRTIRAGAVKMNGTLKVKLAGRAGIPSSGASAVLLHVTVANVTAPGYLTVFADGQAQPRTSNLNYLRGRVVSDSVVVTLPSDGVIDVFASGGPLDVIVDVTGWFGTGSAPGGFVPTAPARLLDTRGTGTAHHPISGSPTTLAVAGRAGVPSSAAAVVLTVTSVNTTRTMPIVVWPAAQPMPGTSTFNSAPGRPVAQLAIVKLGAAGAITAVAQDGGRADLVVDLVGYIAGGTAGPDTVHTVPQTRLLDSRHNALGVLHSGSVRTIQVGGVATVPSLADAAVVTITLVQKPTPNGYVVAWQTGAVRPVTSNANPMSDAPVAQTTIVPLNAAGRFNVSYVGTGDVVVDLVGYLGAAALPNVVAPQVNTTPLSSTAGIQSRQILLTANRYALNTWWPTVAPTLLAKPMNSLQQSDTTDSVRRLAMEAFSLAVSLSTGAYDPTVTGVSAASATAIAIRLALAVTEAHASNRLGGWGASWQSSMWASYAGRAGWLLWGSLTPVQRIEISRMVVSEANFVLTLQPKYMVNKVGVTLTPGDTGAEEDSWYALTPALAVAMMPAAPNRAAWLEQQEQLQIAAWARPADITSNQLVDGRALSSWLAGSNVNANGVVINHSRVAPDYSTNAYQSVDTAVMAALAGQTAPQSSLFGLDAVYTALSTVQYAATPTYKTPTAAPTGAVYFSSTNSTIYYPQGCDWGVGQEIPYALFDADAAAFGFGGGASTSATVAESEHATAAAAMQQRPQTVGHPPSGAMYRNATPPEYIYVGREEHASQLAAQLYLAEDVQAGDLSVTVASRPASVGAHAETRPALPAQNEGIYRR